MRSRPLTLCASFARHPLLVVVRIPDDSTGSASKVWESSLGGIVLPANNTGPDSELEAQQ